jgi:hypothetical protein
MALRPPREASTLRSLRSHLHCHVPATSAANTGTDGLTDSASLAARHLRTSKAIPDTLS